MDTVLTAKLIVMDTGPLITLAAAERLDYLLYPSVPVYIPDAVIFEATRDEAALGAQHIFDWLQTNSGSVHTLTTEVFLNYVSEVEAGRVTRRRSLGEDAALEAIHDAVHLKEGERAVLITEDDRVLRRVLVTDAELTRLMIPITTRDFLDALEGARRIQSADEVYRVAQDRGRGATQRKALEQQKDRAAIAAVRRVMARRDPPGA